MCLFSSICICDQPLIDNMGSDFSSMKTLGKSRQKFSLTPHLEVFDIHSCSNGFNHEYCDGECYHQISDSYSCSQSSSGINSELISEISSAASGAASDSSYTERSCVNDGNCNCKSRLRSPGPVPNRTSCGYLLSNFLFSTPSLSIVNVC